MVAQGEQLVGQVHAVVVLDGSQVRELEQVLPGWSSRETRDNLRHLQGKCVGLINYTLRDGKYPYLWYVGTTS